MSISVLLLSVPPLKGKKVLLTRPSGRLVQVVPELEWVLSVCVEQSRYSPCGEILMLQGLEIEIERYGCQWLMWGRLVRRGVRLCSAICALVVLLPPAY